MLEKDVEKRLIKPVRELGGLCLKFETPGYTGVPDRLLLFLVAGWYLSRRKVPDGMSGPDKSMCRRFYGEWALPCTVPLTAARRCLRS